MASDPAAIEDEEDKTPSTKMALPDDNTRSAVTSSLVNAAPTEPPPNSPVLGPVGPHITDGFGSGNLSNRQHHPHSYQSGPNYNYPANYMPPVPVTLIHHQQPGQPVLYHPVAPTSIMVHDHGYWAYPAMQPFIPTGQVGILDENRNLQPPAQADLSSWSPNASHHGNRSHNDCEAGPHFNQTWGYQQAFSPRDNIYMPHGAAPGHIHNDNDWHVYQYPGDPIYYGSVPSPPEMLSRPPNPVSNPQLPADALPRQESPELRANIVKQIEYYFSDENLAKDKFLLELLDEQGWVPIKRIADFNRVYKMTTNIPVILEALQSSSSVEVQGDQIRRRNDWSKFVSASSHDPVPHSHPTEVQFPTTTTGSTEVIDNNSTVIPDDNNDTTANHTDECLLPASSASIREIKSHLEHSLAKMVVSDGEALTCNEESKGKCKKFASEQLSKSEINIGPNCVTENVSAGRIYGIEKSGTYNSLSSESLQRNVDPKSADSPKLSNLKMQPEGSGRTSNLEGLSYGPVDDSRSFTEEPSIFSLDEELALEHKSSRKGHLPSNTRIDNKDGGINVNDQDLQRLVIVTLESRIDENDRSVLGKESISNEEPSAVDEALLFFEQHLRAKHSGCHRHNSGTNVGGDCKSSTHGNSSLNYKANVNTNGTDDLGHSHSLRQQNKCNNKSSSSSNQRLFQSNVRNHNRNHSNQGAVSQSPPFSFSFGSTPPESNGPPVGSLPKSFRQFQQPSHMLLEANEFNQEKYNMFRKRCLSDRKKFAIGCSEEMNKLYRFWSYFLRNEFKLSMYEEFKKLALEDEAAKCNYGIECLFRFYSYGLETEFRDHLYDDFEKLTLDFYLKGNLYGLEKYWALHHYRDETEPPLKKNPVLERLRNEEYRVLSDFSAKEKARKAVAEENSIPGAKTSSPQSLKQSS